MKKVLFLVLLLAASVSACNAQDKPNKKQESQITVPGGKNKPQVSWRVNKKYDGQGNLVGYDSTYTWSYSNKGKVRLVDADSVMGLFRKQFDMELPGFFKRNFGDPVWKDSLLYQDFTKPDYFMEKWENHYFDMKSMMREMDSMRNSFLQKNYPGLNFQKQ